MVIFNTFILFIFKSSSTIQTEPTGSFLFNNIYVNMTQCYFICKLNSIKLVYSCYITKYVETSCNYPVRRRHNFVCQDKSKSTT
jgi:hypothetical protein